MNNRIAEIKENVNARIARRLTGQSEDFSTDCFDLYDGIDDNRFNSLEKM